MLNLTPEEKTDLLSDIGKFRKEVSDLETIAIGFLKQVAPLTGFQMPLNVSSVIEEVNKLDVLVQKVDYLTGNIK